MRVALVYDRLNKIGGAEKVLEAFHQIYPKADWYTSVWNPRRAPFSKGWRVYTSWVNHIPYLRNHHEWIPWLMPFIFESFDFSAYDLVISIGSAEAKGIITGTRTTHINYCLTPTRYLYSHRSEYLSNPLYRLIAKYLRKWDLVAATRPDTMIAISTQVKKRIKDIYNREVDIIFPPIDTKKFSAKFLSPTSSLLESNYYLTVSRLVPYKRLDKLIEVFNQNGLTLVIVGEGSDLARLKRLAQPNIIFTGAVSDTQLDGYYQNCRAFVHAGEEDFGIAMCEALAAGKPVIARALGGALDIVQDAESGILVQSDTLTDWQRAITACEKTTFSIAACQQNACRFDQTKWITQMKGRIDAICQTHQK